MRAAQPQQRRGRGKSDLIDAHLAVLAALRADTGRLAVPRADGDREALRILLVARREITTARTAQANRLRALLLAGDDTDRQAARKALTQTALAALAGRELPAHASREQTVRQAEISRLALALHQARQQLKHNKAQLLVIADEIIFALMAFLIAIGVVVILGAVTGIVWQERGLSFAAAFKKLRPGR